MKIYTRTDFYKGHIRKDSIRYKGKGFDYLALSSFIEKVELSRLMVIYHNHKLDRKKFNSFRRNLKKAILNSDKIKSILGHEQRNIYLNFNYEGVDCFISR